MSTTTAPTRHQLIVHTHGRLRLTSTGRGSEIYGPCQVCGHHAEVMYFLRLQVYLHRTIQGRVFGNYVSSPDVRPIYGHDECLTATGLQYLDDHAEREP